MRFHPEDDGPELPALFVAAGSGDIEPLKRLLERGTVVNEPLSDRYAERYLVLGSSGHEYSHYEVGSPLAFAIANGKTEAAILLLEAGASVRALEPDQVMPPLAIAVREGSSALVRELLARGASPNGGYETSVLYEAAARGAEDIVRLLLDAGAKVNEAGNEFGETALHAAARYGSRPVVEILLDAGASAQAESEEGTPADVALGEGHDDIAQLLQERKA